MQSTNAPPAHAPGRVDALTGLRIFAAFAIVLHHLQGVLWLPAGAFHGVQLNQGVGFFFVLSGFILQHSYRQRLEPVGTISSAQFAALRFFRLWPCHIAVILLLIIVNGGWSTLAYLLGVLSAGQFLAVTFLLQAWSPDIAVVFAINGPAWSISVELFFYAMFPLLCRQALVSPLRPLCIGGALTLAWLVAVWLYMPGGNFETLGGTHPLARILEFSVGVSAYEYLSRREGGFRSGTAVEVGVLALAIGAVAATPAIAAFAGAKLILLGWWLGNSASFWAFALLIAVFFLQRGLLSRFAGWKPIVYLGEISFALYLVHQPVIVYLAGAAPWFRALPMPVQVVVFVLIVLGLSSALHHFIEKPSMNLAKRFILRRKAAPA